MKFTRVWMGILATLTGAAAGHAVAAALRPGASPVVAVGSVVIDLTPLRPPTADYCRVDIALVEEPFSIGWDELAAAQHRRRVPAEDRDALVAGRGDQVARDGRVG